MSSKTSPPAARRPSHLPAAFLQSLPLPLRQAGFGLLEQLARLRSNTGPALHLPTARGRTEERTLWVFVSTIGELNAIEPFLNRLLEALGHPAMLLISDRGLYAPAFQAKYPQALLATLGGTQAEASALVACRPPLLMLVAEIPARLHDAPCRLSFAMVQAARRADAPVILVNGWLYGYAPPSRMDRIEHALFARDYLQTFDMMLVQTEAVRQALLAAGASGERVVVTGNVKFDAMVSTYGQPNGAQGPGTLHSHLIERAGRGPVIVAGSVTETADQRDLLQAFAQVLAAHPGAFLVLAPRHPENRPRMAALHALLKQQGLDHRMRSEQDCRAALDTSVLVLDTMGELRGCYAAATLAFVGNDHNVLEPLAYGKPVFVGPGWEPTYPSFPVYQQLLAANALHAVDSLTELGPAWRKALAMDGQTAREAAARAEAVLAQARGAVERNMVALARTRVARLLHEPAASA